jgi:hypothetical protein
MTIDTHRSLPVAFRDRLAMDAAHELLLHFVVTLRAGRWHIEFEDGRFRITRGKNVMCPMAVCADRRLLGAGSNSLPVHARLVRNERRCAQAARLHYEFLTVAGTARLRNIEVTHARIGSEDGSTSWIFP